MIGIYDIRNKLNNNLYIGSSVNTENRINGHKSLLVNNKHHSSYLQKAFNKYGEEGFVFEIIECVADKNKLIEREQVWIDYFKPEYNVNKVAGSRLGSKVSEETILKMRVTALKLGRKPPSFEGKNHSEEAKMKISKARLGMKFSEEHLKNMHKFKLGHQFNLGRRHSEEAKIKIGEASKKRFLTERSPMFGKKHSSESLKKMSESHKGKIFTEEHKLKMSKTHKTIENIGRFKKGDISLRKCSILQFDINGTFIGKYSSIKEATQKLKIDNISAVCRGKRNFAGGFIWKFEK